MFAPHISGANESYDPKWYAELASLEAKNFWFVERNRLIRLLATKFSGPQGSYLEVGCGTGFVLQMIRKTFPSWNIYATEAQPEGIEFVKKRVPENVTFYQIDACALPFRSEFDVIGAFDVVEHIDNDVMALSQIYAALKPGGIFMLSVPQHMFLWSKFDELGHHFRRYAWSDLEQKLQSAGFSILVSTSFNTLLLPLMLLSRQMKRGDRTIDVDLLGELRLSPGINFLLSAILRIEYGLIRIGLRLPFGGSRIVVARKAE